MAYLELIFVECSCGAELNENTDPIPALLATATTSEGTYLFTSHTYALKACKAAGWLSLSNMDCCPACRFELEHGIDKDS